MEIEEKIVTGKKFRRFINNIWELISFWHKASDCEMENGNNLEEEIQEIKDYRKNLLVHNKDTGYYQGYIDGEWRDIVNNWSILYLIKDGVINTGHTGGLTLREEYKLDISSNYDEDEYNKNNIHIQKGNNFLSITATIQSHNNYTPYIRATIQTAEKIDLTNYKNFYFKYNASLLGWATGSIEIILIKDEQLRQDTHSKTYSLKEPAYELEHIYFDSESESESSSEFSFDISEFSGKYYIGIRFDGTGKAEDDYHKNPSGDLGIRINDMWLN